MQKVSLCFKMIEQYIYQHLFYLLNYIFCILQCSVNFPFFKHWITF